VVTLDWARSRHKSFRDLLAHGVDPSALKTSLCAHARKVTDGRGLYLLVTPKGARCWRYAYRFAGKYKKLSLGTCPMITIAWGTNSTDQNSLKILALFPLTDFELIARSPLP
jgi:hypothetical protein